MFNKLMNFTSRQDFSKHITLNITDFDRKNYKYEFTKSKDDNQTIFIDFTYNATVRDKTLSITFNRSYFLDVWDNTLDTTELTTPLEYFLFYTPEQEKIVENVETTNKVCLWAFLFAMWPHIFALTLSQIWETIDIIQICYYMLFVSVEYPYSVKQVFGVFKAFTLEFMPNAIEYTMDKAGIEPPLLDETFWS